MRRSLSLGRGEFGSRLGVGEVVGLRAGCGEDGCLTSIFGDTSGSLLVYTNVMGRRAVTVTPSVERLLVSLGERIRLARLRRELAVELVAERAGVSRASVWAVESGSPSVAIGIYAQILLAVGLEHDLAAVAADDTLGRTLQDLGLPTRRRAPRRTS